MSIRLEHMSHTYQPGSPFQAVALGKGDAQHAQ